MTLDKNRRIFLKTLLAAKLAGSAFVVGLLTPRIVLAAWNQKAFGSKNVNDALSNALGSSSTVVSDNIHIKAPDIAADGATVPVTVEAKLSGVESSSHFIQFLESG